MKRGELSPAPRAQYHRLVKYRLAFLLTLLVLAGCNTRRSRGPLGDSSVTVDSSSGDAGDSSTPTDTSFPTDTSVSTDTSVTPDTSVPGACPIFDETDGLGLITSGSTTTETNDQSGSCGGDSAPEAIIIWYPSSAGTWTIDTIGSDYDTLLYVREGTCSGAELACNDDSSGTQSAVTITVTASAPYYIFVDGFSSNSGSFMLNANPGSP